MLSALLLIPFLAESCRPKPVENSAESVSETAADTLPRDFAVFFERFHQDSTYQMEHIIFPLEGLPASTGDGDTLSTSRYFWQRADWKRHKGFTDPGNDFEHWYVVINERIIEHWIQLKGTNLCMRRRFAKLDDGWYLIYYQGLRPTDRE